LVWLLRRPAPVGRGAVRVLTWGGLRGALSVAMALSLPREVAGEAVPERDVILVVTYVVVVFSVLVQGPTIGPLTRRWLAGAAGLGGEKAHAAGVSSTKYLE
jgi:CPA1 family monovalent cation:H+ antiporter